MKYNRSFISALLILLIIVSGFQYEAKGQVQGKWSGRVTYLEIVTGIGDFRREKKVFVDIRDNQATGTIKDNGKDVLGSTDCAGSGKANLAHVSINYGDSTYTIHVESPGCIGTSFSKLSGETTPFGPEITDIVIDEKPLINSNVLEGTETRTADIVPGSYTRTTTISWSLARTADAELIVTPSDYDNWLPTPGRDELTKGSVMNIALKVRGHNGQPSALKAKSFELKLSNTSTEPGITINFPVSPRANQLPDLRLLPPLAMAESINEDQFISIPCNDGSTGKVSIGSYDGGGWTTLTAAAILEDGAYIKGHLLVSGGETDIPVPKRNPGSIIATGWLTANGNPGEMDDNETSAGNNNKGDGLTAYEEYRGVISLGKFKRLDPRNKELGILLKQSEIGLFSEGFTRFQIASGIIVRLFDKYEIPANRRLNQNASSAHDFNQFVLRVNKGHTGQPDVYGGVIVTAWGVTYPQIDIPARVTHVVVDFDRIFEWYKAAVMARGATRLLANGEELAASTVAHELGHAVNISHHGLTLPYLPSLTATTGAVPSIQIFDYRGSPEITTRPYPIDGGIDSPGSHQSGNVSCFMCYRNKSKWVRLIGINNELLYYKIPELPAGSIFCTNKLGTDINDHNKYFGNAINGNCRGQIKLRD